MQVIKINEERFALWRRRANEHGATPILMIEIGHGVENGAALGQLLIQTTEDLSLEFLEATLRATADNLRARRTDAPA